MPDDRSLARKRAAPTTSSAVAMRPSGRFAIASQRFLDRRAALLRPLAGAGQQRVGRDRSGAERIDADAEAADVAAPRPARCRAPHACSRCRPPAWHGRSRNWSSPWRRWSRPAAFISGTACLTVAMTPRALTAKTRSHSARSTASRVVPGRNDAGIGHDDVEAAELFAHACDGARDVVFPGDVAALEAPTRGQGIVRRQEIEQQADARRPRRSRRRWRVRALAPRPSPARPCPREDLPYPPRPKIRGASDRQLTGPAVGLSTEGYGTSD